MVTNAFGNPGTHFTTRLYTRQGTFPGSSPFLIARRKTILQFFHRKTLKIPKGTLAQALFRRPGVALLTTGLAGLVASPFQLIGFQALLISLAVGVAQELPFVVSGYRYWKRWVFWVAGLAYGLLVTGAAFGILRGGELSALGATLVVISFFISPPIFTAVALWLADALAKAGVARGLRRSEARPLHTDPNETTGK